MGIGDCPLDLRTAELDGDDVTITVSQRIGDTTIVVPRHVDVELSGLFLIGSKTVSGSDEELPPAAPRLRVRGFGLVGELKVVRS
jgi:predicted membrane protein